MPTDCINSNVAVLALLVTQNYIIFLIVVAIIKSLKGGGEEGVRFSTLSRSVTGGLIPWQLDGGWCRVFRHCAFWRLARIFRSSRSSKATRSSRSMALLCSGRAVCRYLRLSRSTYRYRRMVYGEKEQPLIQRLEALTLQNPRYGYCRITALLRQEGWRVGKRHIQRLRRSLGMRVPPPRKKIPRRGHSTGLPTHATHKNHVWTWDFIADATKRGGTIRILTILDGIHPRMSHPQSGPFSEKR